MLAYFWSILAGLLVPCLVVLIGLLALLLDSDGLADSAVRLGTHLYVPLPPILHEQPALMQLTSLVAITFVLAFVFCFAVWMNRRAADYRARQIVKSLHETVLAQSLRRA